MRKRKTCEGQNSSGALNGNVRTEDFKNVCYFYTGEEGERLFC